MVYIQVCITNVHAKICTYYRRSSVRSLRTYLVYVVHLREPTELLYLPITYLGIYLWNLNKTFGSYFLLLARCVLIIE